MEFDFKKEMEELYSPKAKPEAVFVPAANYIAIRGRGDPNEPDGDYQKALHKLYAIAYTVKNMSKAGKIEGGFGFVVPPLEGFWHNDAVCEAGCAKKSEFSWISVIRLPDFVKKSDFEKALQEAERKKKLSFSEAEFLHMEEGLCAQILHIGSYDEEPSSVAVMDKFILENGYKNDISEKRAHHEIYLSDPRKVPEEKRRTVIRHPIVKE